MATAPYRLMSHRSDIGALKSFARSTPFTVKMEITVKVTVKKNGTVNFLQIGSFAEEKSAPATCRVWSKTSPFTIGSGAIYDFPK